MGVVPNLFLRSIEPSVERLINQVRQGLPARAELRIRNWEFGMWKAAPGMVHTGFRKPPSPGIPNSRIQIPDSDRIPDSRFQIPE
jgi:hypothetical protein